MIFKLSRDFIWILMWRVVFLTTEKRKEQKKNELRSTTRSSCTPVLTGLIPDETYLLFNECLNVSGTVRCFSSLFHLWIRYHYPKRTDEETVYEPENLSKMPKVALESAGPVIHTQEGCTQRVLFYVSEPERTFMSKSPPKLIILSCYLYLILNVQTAGYRGEETHIKQGFKSHLEI